MHNVRESLPDFFSTQLDAISDNLDANNFYMSMYTFDIEFDDAGFFRMEPRWIILLVPLECESLSEREYESASSHLSDFGYELLYLPKLAKIVPDDLLNYYIPECKGRFFPCAEVLQNKIIGELGIVVHSPLAIMLRDGKFHCIESWEGDETPTEFLDFLYEYLEEEDTEHTDTCHELRFSRCLAEPDIMFSKVPVHTSDSVAIKNTNVTLDECNSLESLILELREVNEAKLRELGLSEEALRFLMGKVIPKVSRLRITKHSRIILEDYDCMEIKLDDKTKALYFLFLRHPEGIAIKDLPEHINELLDLYQSISGRDNPEAMRKTIENLADPFQNNANISLSRIKKAFCEAFSQSLACKYYVEGERGGLRSVSLSRDQIIWETIR